MTVTLAEIEAKYNARREWILKAIYEERVSASMSTIECYPKPRGELDMSNPSDAEIVEFTLKYAKKGMLPG